MLALSGYNFHMNEILFLLVLLAVIWFWLDSMRARELALQAARRACKQQEMQLLDETVALIKLRLGRDDSGHVVWRRQFRFEFTHEGANRSQGEVGFLGRQITSLYMDMGSFALHELDND